MTRLDIMAMSEEEINLVVARDIMKLDVKEVKSERISDSLYITRSEMLVYELRAGYDVPVGTLPDYTKDLNLCYEVEEQIKEMKKEENYAYFIKWIISLSQNITEISSLNFVFDTIHASPLTRMRAALLCV